MRKCVIMTVLTISLFSTLPGISVFAMDAADGRAPLVENVLGFDPEASSLIFEGATENIISATTTASVDSVLEAFSHVALENLEDLRRVEQAIQSFDSSGNTQLILADLHQLKSTIITLKLEITELGQLQKGVMEVGAGSSDKKDPSERISMLHKSIQKLLAKQKALINQIFNQESYRVYEESIRQMQVSLTAQKSQQNEYRERVGEASYRRTHGTREERESVCPDHLILGLTTNKVIPDFTPALFDAFKTPDVFTGERNTMATTQLNGKLWKIFALEILPSQPIREEMIKSTVAARIGTNTRDPRVQSFYSKHIQESQSGIVWRKINDRSDDLGGTLCVYESAIRENSSIQTQYRWNPTTNSAEYIHSYTRITPYTFAFVPAEEGDSPIVRQDTIARQIHHAKRMHTMRQQGFEPIPFKNLPNLHKDSTEVYEEKVRSLKEKAMMEMKERIARARVHALQNGTIDRESHEQIHASRTHKAGQLLHSSATRLSKKEIDFYGSDLFIDTLPTSRQIHQFIDRSGMPATTGRQIMSDAVNQRVARGLSEIGERRSRIPAPAEVVDEEAVYAPRTSSEYERRVHGRMEKGATVYGTGTARE